MLKMSLNINNQRNCRCRITKHTWYQVNSACYTRTMHELKIRFNEAKSTWPITSRDPSPSREECISCLKICLDRLTVYYSLTTSITNSTLSAADVRLSWELKGGGVGGLHCTMAPHNDRWQRRRSINECVQLRCVRTPSWPSKSRLI